MLEIRALGLDGVLEIVPRKFSDERGFFSETYNAETLLAHGIALTFVQDNHSYSAMAGTVRGLHYQLPPRAQAKLVRVVRGRAFDVVVDIRRGSSTFAQWVGVELSAEKWNQILVPVGFAHGLVTLEPETEVLYKVSEHYSAEHDRAIRFDDPQIGIRWPVAPDRLCLSAKDRDAPLLANASLSDFDR
ncbi:dTDP-4-dehydrorhamnose 3,5-epimerase [Sinorhizobium chiapasense]|uniref:dTDP-4-dehydrorhamnose 3,5-epimerase n=1 Tax=Sinorhizobium chiapasense TaxID=501572 RepID=A0ABZ2BKJ1_9HYPH